MLRLSDRTSRLWSTDRVHPLRLFVGHHDDVTVVRFHPNCHYVATGSSDRSVRLWDVSVGHSVRALVGHQAEVTALTFDAEGRYVYSGAADGHWIQWDISSARIVAQGRDTQQQQPHRQPSAAQGGWGGGMGASLTSISVSGEGELLATSSLSGQVSVWGINKGAQAGEGGGATSASAQGEGQVSPLQSWRAKSTALTHLHFSPRNLLLALGAFRLD